MKKTILFSLIPGLLGLCSLLINHAKGFSFEADHDIYPLNALYNLDFAFHKYIKTYNYEKSSADFTFEAVKDRLAPEREIVVLVVGETTRAANWSLYGYGRNTNPLLSKREDLIVFRDALTQGNTTHKIVPMILSNASAEDFEIIYSQKSITTAFKESGYHTLFLSNQIPDRALIDAFAAEADTMVRLSDRKLDDRHPYDNEGLVFIEQYIKETTGPLFIVFHTYGSHFEYSQRYAPENAIFTPHKAGALRYKEKAIFLNAYDNTICNVDRLLNGLIEILDKDNLCSSMIYLSDHGEDLMDDERKMFLHCSPVPTYYQLHIPMIGWASEKYKVVYGDKYDSMMTNKDKAVSANVVFHTLLDMAAIATPYLNKELSVASDSFCIPERHFIDEHDEPIDFYRIGLKEQDWKMMKKMGINL